MIIRKRACSLIAAALIAASAAATTPAASAEPHHPVNFTIFYPIGTNQDPAVSTNFRLSLIYSRVGSVKGLDVGGLVARVDGDMRGLQFAVLHSYTGRDLAGATMSAGVNYVGGEARGVQAGLVNFDRGRFAGVQYGYAFNYVEDDVRGIQMSSLFNLVNNDARYLQIASVANAVGGSFRGVQLSVALNHVNGAMTGLQLSAANVAADAKGVQAGGLNVAGTMKGAQVGLVNLSRELDGVPIGVVNWTDGADADWVTWGSNLAGVASGARIIVNDWYSVFSLGVSDMLDDVSDTGFIGWHYGRLFRVSRGWSLGADLGYLHIIPPRSDDPSVNDTEHPALQGRLSAEWRYNKTYSFFAGGGVSAVWDAYDIDADARGEPLFFGGVSLF